MTKMLTNNYFYCPSHSYLFETTIFSAMVWGPQLHLVFLIHLYSEICFAKDVQKNVFWGRCSNKILDSQTRAFSKIQKHRNKYPTVKLGSLGHNSLEYCAYLSSPWPWVIIPIKVMGNCPSPQIILFATYNFGNAIFY